MSAMFSAICEIHSIAVDRSSYCPICVADRAKAMAARIRNGEMLREVGASYGLTGERVRQIVTALDPSATKVGQTIRAEQRGIAREIAREKLLAAHLPCAICLGPIRHSTRPGLKTCSRRCGELWQITRLHLSEEQREQHRLVTARYHIRNPEVARQCGKLHHAENVLAGTARRYLHPPGPVSTKVKAALEEVARLRTENASTEWSS